MPDRAVSHATFIIRRRYPAAAERVFAAFADPAAKRRWFAGDRGMAVEGFEMNFRVGGHDQSRYRLGEDTPFPGVVMVNDTVYQDIVPGRRIVFAYTMAIGEHRISASLSTVELTPMEAETELLFTEQAAFFEGADGPVMREEGWNTLLGKLGEELGR